MTTYDIVTESKTLNTYNSGDEINFKDLNGGLVDFDYEKIGNDVVLSTDVSFYLTVNVNYDKITDGENEYAIKGLTDVTYVNISDETDIIEKAAYDALDAGAKAAYKFNQGTLTLDLGEFTPDTRYYFMDSALYFNTALDKDVKFAVDLNDLNNIKSGNYHDRNGFYAAYWDAMISHYGSEEAAREHDITMSELKIYQVINGESVNVTDSYIAGAGAAADEMAYNKDLYTAQEDDLTVTLTNYATDYGQEHKDIYVNGDSSTGANLSTLKYSVVADGNYEASWLKENISLADGVDTASVTGLKADDNINLTSGALERVWAAGESDKLTITNGTKSIVVSDYFAGESYAAFTLNDEELPTDLDVTLATDGAYTTTGFNEKIHGIGTIAADSIDDSTAHQLWLNDGTGTVKYTRINSGTDLTVAQNGQIRMTATLSAGTFDTVEYKAGEYTFELKKITVSEAGQYVNKAAWVMVSGPEGQPLYRLPREDEINREVSPVQPYAKIYMLLDGSEIDGESTAGTVTITDAHIFRGELDITDAYRTAAAGDYLTYNTTLIDEIKVTGFNFADAEEGNIFVNGAPTDANTVINATVSDPTYTATDYVDNITAMANTTISNMERGKDALIIGDGVTDKTFNRTAGSDNLVIDGEVDVTLANYFQAIPETGDVTVDGTSLEGMDLNVELNAANAYAGTRYAEVLSLGADETTASVSGLKADDNINLTSGALERVWAAGEAAKLTITDGTNSIVVTDYFAGESYAAFTLNDEALPGELDVTLAQATAYTFDARFTESVHGAGTVNASDINVDGANKDRIVDAAPTYTRENDGNLKVGNIEIVGFNFDAATGDDATYINVNGTLTDENLAIATLITSGGTYEGSAYTDTIVVNTEVTGVNYSGLAEGDSLTVTDLAETSTYNRDMTSPNALTVKNGDDVLVSVTDYATNSAFTFTGVAPANAKLIVTNAEGFDASTQGWGFGTFDITGTGALTGGAGADTITGSADADTITGKAGADTLTGNGGADTFVFNAGDGADTITDANAGDIIKFADKSYSALSFTRVAGFDLEIAYSETDKVTIEDFFVDVKADRINNIVTLDGGVLTPHTISDLAVFDIVLDEVSGPFDKAETDYAGYKVNILLPAENHEGFVSGLEDGDNINLADGVLERVWAEGVSDKLTITDGTNSITVTDYFAGESYAAFTLKNSAEAPALITTFGLDVELNDNENAYLADNRFVESVHGFGTVAAADFAIDGLDKIVTTDGATVSYQRRDEGDLVIRAVDGLEKDNITVTGFNFAGGTDINVNSGDTQNITIDVTLTGALEGAYHSASGYAERITTIGDSSILFYPEGQYIGQDTLVFGTENITYKRSGDDLVITHHTGVDTEISTTVLGYYTSDNMAEEGQFARAQVAAGEINTKLGDLKVSYIENVSNITGTDNEEAIELVTTTGVIPQNASGDFPNYDGETGKYTSNVLGNREVKIDAYAAGMGGDDLINGTAGNDWINGGDGGDTIYGGTSGKDMLAGGDGENIILAGDFSGATPTPNTDGVEIYGGKDKDTIYVGGNNETENYIWAHGGNDVINLYGGKNTIMLVEDGADATAGNDTIVGATSLDTLKFVSRNADGSVLKGFAFSDLVFDRVGADLTITTPDASVTTIADFFKGQNVDAILTSDSETPHSIKNDVVFDVVLDSEHPTFDKATSGYAGYRVNVIANDSEVEKYTIEGLSATDNVTTGSATYKYTKYDGQLNKLFVNNVELVNYESDVKIDGNAIDYANSTVNYIMSNQGSQYNRINHGFGTALISGVGQINYFGSDTTWGPNDKLVLDVESVDEDDNPLYSFTYDDSKQWEQDALVITDGINRFQVDGASISEYNFIPPVKDLNLADVELDVVNVLNSFDATTFPGGFGSVNVSAYDSGVGVTLTGATGDDTLRGASGNDTITGGKGDDVLYGKGGNDTFVFNAEDGADLIMDAKEGDIIKFNNKTFSELGFIKNGDDLEIAYGNNDTVAVYDFFKGQNVDTILTTDGEKSIKDDVVFDVVLTNGETFDKATSGYGDYRVAVSGNGSVTNLGANDKLVTSGETVEYMRENDGGLIVWSGNGELQTDKITVTDFNFDGAHDITVNNGTTENMILNVDLDGTVTYAATPYNEIFSGVGSVTGFVNSKDGVEPDGSPVLTRINNSADLSVDGITIKNFDFSVSNPFRIFDGNTYTQSTDYPIYVTLSDVGEEPTEYQSTGYKEYIDGKGIVNLSGDHPFDLSQDAVYVDGWADIHYTREDNWDLHFVQGDDTDITVKGFNFAGGTDFRVTDGTTTELTTNITIDVTLTGIIGAPYISASGYAERITTVDSTAIQFYPEGQYTGQDTLVFNTSADNLDYARDGKDLIITNGEVVTTVLGYYDSYKMEDAGLFSTVIVDTTTTDTTLGALSVTDIYNVSKVKGTNADEVIQLTKVGADEVLTQPEGNDFPHYNPTTGEYTSNATGVTAKVESYAYASGGNDKVYGTDGNDWINGAVGNDELYGGTAGYDMLSGEAGNDVIFAGEAVAPDTTGAVEYRGIVDDSIYNVKLSEGSAEIYGGDGSDLLVGGNGDDYINGGAGNDVIYGNAGDDKLISGEGNDNLYGGDGDDKIFINGAGSKYVEGGDGNDTFNIIDTNAVVTIKDGSSADKISFAYLNNIGFNNLDFAQAENEKDLVISYKNILGATGKVVVEGYFDQAEANRLTTFNVKGTEYTLEWHYSNVDKEYHMYNVTHNPDGVAVTGIRNWIDGKVTGDDGVAIIGQDQYDMLAGTQNGDFITAGDNGAELYGDKGNDILIGGEGSDYLRGNAGDDTLTGNGGADIFMIEDGDDIITDAKAEDTIKFVVEDETTFEGITFEKDGTSLKATYGETWSATIEGYFGADGKVAADHVNTFILASENGQATYNLEWLHSNSAAMFGEASDAMYNVTKNPDGVAVAGIRNWIDGKVTGDDGVAIIGQDQYDMLAGTQNDDLIGAGNNGAELYGDKGDDTLIGGEGSDYLRGNAGDDTLAGGDGADIFMIESGDDVIVDATAEDTIKFVVEDETTFEGITFEKDGTSLKATYGETWSAKIEGYFGADGKVAEGHVNTFILASENGQATYTLEWLHSNSAAMFGEASDAMYNVTKNPDGATVEGIRNWVSGPTNESVTILGQDQYDMLAGGQKDDLIGAGNNGAELYGDKGDDTLIGGEGRDYIRGNAGDDTLTGNGGADIFMIESGDDVIVDATAEDTIKFVVEDETTFEGITFEKDGTSLKATYGQTWSATIEGYFGADGKVAADHVNTFILASENGQATYNLEWLHSNSAAMFGEASDAMYNVSKNPDGVAVAGIRNWIDGKVTGDDGVAIIGQDQYDMLAGTQNDDLIGAGNNGAELYGDKGDDTLIGGAGRDYIRGSAGDDTLAGGGGADIFMIESGDDVIVDATAEDTIKFVVEDETTFEGITFEKDGTSLKATYGETWSATIEGYFGADGKVAEGHVNTFILASENGQKTYNLEWLHSNSAAMFGEASDAMYNVTKNPDGATVEGIRNWVSGPTNESVTILGQDQYDMLAGGQNDDLISAGNNGAELYGDKGDDTLIGGEGSDYIRGNAGDDTLAGNGGADIFMIESGDDVIVDATAEDTIKFVVEDETTFTGITFEKDGTSLKATYGQTWSATIEGYFGADGKVAEGHVNTFILASENGQATYNLEWLHSNTTAIADAMYNVTKNPDGATVSGIRNWVSGATDQVVEIIGQDQYDMLAGGQNDDTIQAGALSNGAELYGDAGDDLLIGGAGNDYIQGDGNKVAVGGDDILQGMDGDDKLITDGGDDEVYGGDGDDKIFINGAGSKYVEGGDGKDTYNIIDLTADVEIGDAEAADTLSFHHSEYKFSDLIFTRFGDDLAITFAGTEDIGSVFVYDFFTSENPINTVVAYDKDGEEQTYSILTDAIIDVNLDQFNGAPYTATDYRERFSGAGIVDLGDTDQTKEMVESADPVLTRINNGGLTIDDVTFIDFDFDTDKAITIVDGNTATQSIDYPITVTLFDVGGLATTYNATGYTEIFTGEGVVKNYDYAKDVIFSEDLATTAYSRVNDGPLTVNGITVDGFDFTDDNDVRVTDGETTIIATNMNLDVTLTNQFEYVATKYNEAISGLGSVTGMSENDKIVLHSETTFALTEEGLSVSAGVEEITVTDYVKGNEPKVYVGASRVDISGKTLYVAGLDNYDATTEDFNFYNVDIIGTDIGGTYKGSANNDIILGGAGVDTIYGGDGKDEIYGGEGADTLYGEDGNDKIYGNNGDDTIYGGEGNDTIEGGAGHDEIYTGKGNDVVDAGEGNDTIVIDGAGNKTITGGDGNDIFYFKSGSAIITDAKAGDKIKFESFGTSKVDFVKDGTSLVISSVVEGDTDTITVENYFNADGSVAENHINKFVIGDKEYTFEWYPSNVDGESHMYNVINGTPNKDTLLAIDGIRNWINGAEEADQIFGADHKDMLAGNDGDDTIVAITPAEIYGAGGDDKIYAYGGDSFIVGGTDDDEITVSGGGNTICLINTTEGPVETQHLFGNDVVTGATSTDMLKFSVDYGEGAATRFVGYKADELRAERLGTDLVISALKEGGDYASTVTLTDYFLQEEKDRIDKIMALNEEGTAQIDTISLTELVNDQVYDEKYDEEDVSSKNTVTGSTGNDYVNVSYFTNPDGKGVKIDTKSGDDTVIGTQYNDTIKSSSKENESDTITEYGGTNKITTGKGDDAVFAYDYSNNTINVGDGDNKVVLSSTGKNKVTAKNGDNEILITAGSNTVKFGNGSNLLEIEGGVNTIKTGKGSNAMIIEDGVNKITTGKGQDAFIIAGGNNTIKSGVGADEYNIVDGYNTIKTGNATSTFTISQETDIKDPETGVLERVFIGNGGVNIITSGSKVDTFNISAGQNTIKSGSGDDILNLYGGLNDVNAGKGNDIITITAGNNKVNGAKGNDIYKVDMVDFDFDEDKILITDTSGKNVLDLAVAGEGDTRDALNLFFDVELKKNKKGDVVLKKGNPTAVYSTMTFTTDELDGDFDGDAYGIDVSSKKSITTVKINGTDYALNYKDIDALAQDVANWLNTNHFTSTEEAFRADADNINELIAKYAAFSDLHFGNPIDG